MDKIARFIVMLSDNIGAKKNKNRLYKFTKNKKKASSRSSGVGF